MGKPRRVRVTGPRASRAGTPSLAAIDGVPEAMGSLGLDPNKGLDVTQFYGAAPRWCARARASVALLDHATKDKEGRGRWAIGRSAS